MPKFGDKTLAVTGAGGHLGRAVIDYLLERGATNVVAVTRKPEKLGDLAAKGVDVRYGDYDNPASLDAAFAGADRVLVVSTDDLLVAGGRAAQHIRAIDAAVRAGASNVFYTGISSPHPLPAALVARDHFLTEQRLAQLDIDWTSLRNSIYAEMVLFSAPRAIETGSLVHAAGSGRTSYVTRDDAAAAAAGALLTSEGKQIYDVTGPVPVSREEIAALLSNSTGKPIAAANVPPQALLDGMLAAGLPPAMAGAFLHFDTDAAKGYFAITSDAVKLLAGREPTSVAEFIAQNRVALAA